MKAVLAVGGTGGHVLPAVVLAEQLSLQTDDGKTVLAGVGLEENRFFPEKLPWERRSISGGRNLFATAKGVWESFRWLRTFQPDVVVGFGSYHAAPILAAATLLRIPIVLYEGNCIPGRVTRLFSPFARYISHALPFKGKEHLITRHVAVQPLLNQALLKGSGSRDSAAAYFGLEADRFTFLVFGGSQGAFKINTLFCNAIVDHIADVSRAYQIIHLTGDAEIASRIEALYKQAAIPAYVAPYEKRMERAWRLADCLVGRAGASTLLEMVEAEVPGLLIPYPHASDNHQQENADFMAKEVQGAWSFAEETLSPERLAQQIRHLVIDERAACQAMQRNIQTYKKRQTRRMLASLVCELSGEKER